MNSASSTELFRHSDDRRPFRLLPVALTLAVLVGAPAFANNIRVSNVRLTGQNAALDTYQVKFDIAWDNSWRTSTLESNWDAAWVFLKFREDPETTWQHGNLNVTGHVAPAGATIVVPFEFGTIGYGAFIYRDSNGLGNVSFADVELQWNYGASVPDNAFVDVDVAAIEMVYIPGGPFVVGDDSSTPTGNFEAGNSNNSFTIASENPITLGGTSVTNLSNNNSLGMAVLDDYNYGVTQTLPTNYPKGFKAFYIMKYELTQGQYADFLNKLTPAGAINHFPNQNGGSGHNLDNTGVPPAIYASTTPERGCNYLTWSDIAAYADWSGLRPLSELEFEKASRGTRPSTPDELAWGNANAANDAYTYSNAGTASEKVTNPAVGSGNAVYILTRGFPVGPRRAGILAASAFNPTRQESGASFYGVMEMSGNVWELTVSTGTATGRNFNGNNHGNGIVSSSTGNSTVIGWPPTTGGSAAVGTGVRGGGHPSSLPNLRVSDRDLSNIVIDFPFSDVGGRLVRSKL